MTPFGLIDTFLSPKTNLISNLKYYSASTNPASICLLNVMTEEIIAYYSRLDTVYRIDAITFNAISAELVVSVTLFAVDGMFI